MNFITFAFWVTLILCIAMGIVSVEATFGIWFRLGELMKMKNIFDDLAAHLRAQIDQLVFDSSCKVCFERAMDTVLLPCGHFFACEGCAENIVECPICRANTEEKLRIYIV